MAKRSKSPNGGLTPGKAIAIGILSIVLLIVVVSQFSGKQPRVAVQPTAEPSAAESSEPTTSSARTDAATASQPSGNPWPTFNVAEIAASNPFVLPEILRPRREATKALTSGSEPGEDEENIAAIESAGVREMQRRQAEFMTSLRAKGVDMILRSSRGSVARIGDLSLRVGEIHEGLRVEAILQNEVVFAPVEVADGRPE